jgi:hypothetical protein
LNQIHQVSLTHFCLYFVTEGVLDRECVEADPNLCRKLLFIKLNSHCQTISTFLTSV